MTRFKDNVAIVTGASRGIGRTTALALAAEGASVVVNYVTDESAAQKTLEEIAKCGGRAIAQQADVA